MIASNYRDGNGDLDSWLTTREKYYALKEIPTFFEYCNYVFPLVSSVVGPSFEFRDWNEFLNMKEPYKSMPSVANFVPAFIRLGQGLLCIGVSPLISAYFPLNDIISS
jgi:lysophospholipid acyltransferase